MVSSDSWRALYPFMSREVRLAGLRYHYLDENGGGAPQAADAPVASGGAVPAAAPQAASGGNGETPRVLATGSAGETVLAVHGNPTWSFYWRNLILGLAGRARVVAPDHIGCGLSDKPARYRYTLAQHTENLLELVRQLDLRNITLVAHDWGGAIGLGAAAAEPERFARIVLLNTAAFPPPYVPLRIRACRTPVLGRLAVQGLNAFAGAALWMAVERQASLSSAARAGLIAPYDGWGNRVATYQFVRDIPLTRRHPTWQTLAQLEAALPTLANRPVQLIWGMRDWCFRPECLERLLASFPNAEVHRLEDVGHYVMEEAPDQVVAALCDLFDRTPLPGEPRATDRERGTGVAE